MARLVKRFVEHCEKAPAAQNNETLQNTPLPAGKGSDFRLPQLPEYRKPDRQVIPLQTEVPQNRLHSQPPGGKPLLRKITHLAASETIVPLPSMRIDRNPGRNAPQSIFIRQLFHCHCVPAMPLLRRFRRQDIHSKESPDHRTTTRPNLFQEYVFQRGSYSTRDTNISSI